MAPRLSPFVRTSAVTIPRHDRLEHVRRDRVVREHLVVDGIFPELGVTMVEQEQANGQAYEMFKDMAVADPNLDPSFRERILHECREYFNIVAPTGQPCNSADK